jgi:hypothetical protein
MTHLMMQFPEAISDRQGTFHARVMARPSTAGGWEAWLEFVPTDSASIAFTTPIETQQRDRATIERWASGLTHVYAEGALSRARTHMVEAPVSDLLAALQEMVGAMDRGIPYAEWAGEADIAADAHRLRETVNRRLMALRRADEPVA